jgi:hypothetical protein
MSAQIMIALPGEKYFAVPRDVLEKHAVSKQQFDSELAAKKQADVEGQESPFDDGNDTVMGVRG